MIPLSNNKGSLTALGVQPSGGNGDHCIYAGVGTDRVTWDAHDTICEKEIDLLA